MATRTERTNGKSPAQMFALVFGAVYVLVGLAGFLVTGFDGFFADSFDEKLIVFSVNPAHNVVHLLIGAAWLGAASRHDTAKTANVGIGAAYLLVFLLGVVGVLEWLAIPSGFSADDGLHLLSGAAAVYFGTAGAEGTGTRTTTA
jgi:hypothetical protein